MEIADSEAEAGAVAVGPLPCNSAQKGRNNCKMNSEDFQLNEALSARRCLDLTYYPATCTGGEVACACSMHAHACTCMLVLYFI